ncbi:MAG TPA: RNA polymerase sigma factor [Chloroflexaceae bacterium]|nr:RNA polymerase sigma factor [Chloroflexaceae bacterium]
MGVRPSPACSRSRASQALTELYQLQSAALIAHLDRLLRQRPLAEDLCHETFLRAWRHWRSGGPPAEARAWLYRVATNLAYDELRRRRRRAEVGLREQPLVCDVAGAQFSQIEDRDLVQWLLAALTPETAALLVARFAERRALHDLSARLALPEGTLKSRSARARARLRLLLERADI